MTSQIEKRDKKLEEKAEKTKVTNETYSFKQTVI